MVRHLLWALLGVGLFACGGDDSSSGSGGSGGSTAGASGSATGGAGGSTTGGTGGSTTGGTGGSTTGGTGGSTTGGTGGSTTGGAAGSTSGGTGGSAGSTSGGAAGTSSGGAAGSGGTGGGQACTWGGAACPSGQYCNATGCGTGTCSPIPSETNDKSPVCGCDGVTYWNASVAANAGVSTKSSGVCTTGGKTCGGIAGQKCPAKTACNYSVSSSASCNIADLAGSCWGLPDKCPTILIGPQTRECKATTCTSECELIKGQKVWYPDNTCPT